MKILIALATFNRPLVTRLCLASLQGARGRSVRLVVYDDASTAYTPRDLAPLADEVVRFAATGGIAHSRARALRDFVDRFTDFDLLYFTDNDALHDPGFIEMLERLFAWQSLQAQAQPVSLYRTKFHDRPGNLLAENAVFFQAASIPGISQCYSREMAGIILRGLERSPALLQQQDWDFVYPQLLNRPCIFTRQSFVEHLARDRDEAGLHCANSGLGEAGRADFERDRAIQPTPWLAARREAAIRHILGLSPQNPGLNAL